MRWGPLLLSSITSRPITLAYDFRESSVTLARVLAGLRDETTVARHSETGMWVASVLRERIAAGQLPPGSKLSEETLCEVLGVSRNTLREAFSTLAAERIVTRIPNRGVFVSRPSADDIREIYRVRRFLEPAALLWSAESDLSALHQTIERARAARDAGSVPGMATGNQDFHAGVVALAGSDRLDVLMMQVLAEMRLVFHSMDTNPDFHAPYIDENAQLLELLAIGARVEAAERMSNYLNRSELQVLAAHTAAEV